MPLSHFLNKIKKAWEIKRFIEKYFTKIFGFNMVNKLLKYIQGSIKKIFYHSLESYGSLGVHFEL